MAEEGHFHRAYKLKNQADVNQLYDDWAGTYDREVTQNGYVTPDRVAEALSRFLPKDAKVLDIGCGTGLSGIALRNAGFTNITGTEINDEMRKRAEESGIYSAVMPTDIDNPYPFAPGTYDAMTAVGVISSGAAPASLLDASLQALGPGGLIAFSFNDHALSEPEFPAAVDAALSTGVAEQLLCEHGEHLTAKGVGANVYVLKRL